VCMDRCCCCFTLLVIFGSRHSRKMGILFALEIIDFPLEAAANGVYKCAGEKAQPQKKAIHADACWKRMAKKTHQPDNDTREVPETNNLRLTMLIRVT
jgi:hypothetical protein